MSDFVLRVVEGNAAGTDLFSSQVVSSTATNSPLVTVQTAVNLLVKSFSASPTTVGTGRAIDVIMELKNQGQTNAVHGSPLATCTIQGIPGTRKMSGPTPLPPLQRRPLLIGVRH